MAVLVTDPDEDFLRDMREGLAMRGIKCQTFRSAEQALSQFDNDPPFDVVVTALDAPGIGGFELLRKLRHRSSNRHFAGIVLSDVSSVDTTLLALRSRVFDFLHKPVSIEEVHDAVLRARKYVEEQGRPVVQLAREFALAQIIASHRTREKIFGRRLTNAAWDMFVEIAFEEMQGRQITVSSALNSSGVPMSTAKRHLYILEHLQLIERSPDEADRRSVLLSTSAKGRKLLDGFAEAYVGRCNSAQSTISCEPPQNENHPGFSPAPRDLPNSELDRGRNRPSGRL